MLELEPEPEPEPEFEPETAPARAPAPEESMPSAAEIDAMFKGEPEPEPIQSAVPEEAAADEQMPDEIENLPDPEPIPQVLTSSDADADEKPQKKKRGLGMIIGIVVAVLAVGGIVAGLFFFRESVMRIVPFTQKIFEIVGLAGESLGAGLDIRRVTSERANEGGVDVLVVRGVIANVSDVERQVPLVRVILFDASNKEVQSVTVTPPKPSLGPATEVGFRAPVRDPSPLARRVEVTFVPRADQQGDKKQ